jgi:hypothetical protein
VRGLLTTLKKIFFWNYARNTWQWDVLCVVCLIFIFLTPAKWFSNSERARGNEHQSRIAKTWLLSAQDVVNEADRSQIEQLMRTRTGRADAQVVDVRRVVGTDGRTIGFEVDIK